MKLFKYTDKNEPINYFGTDNQVEIPSEYIQKNFRAMWVSNVVNIDLPIADDLKEYQAKVIEMLDTCIAFKLNAIFFQVRTTNDAFYESKLNPYSRYLTGKEGNKPEIDILTWVIEETKKRGIEFHAWCNPYRISVNGNLSIDEYLKTCDDLNFAKKHPEHIILDKSGKLILNPAKKEVQDFIINSMKELATNYDISGIHFDDYFYPYSGLDDKLNDLAQYKEVSDIMTLGDFRRNSVNLVVKGVYEAIKNIDTNISFGISPFGIYKNKKADEDGSNTDEKCSESYYGQYADTLHWMTEGIIDYVVPQIYWEFGHKIAPFADICDWWAKTSKETNTKLYVGHGAYRLGNEGEFSNSEEVVNQVKYANQFDSIAGNVFFTYKNFIDQDKAKPGMDKLKKLLNEV